MAIDWQKRKTGQNKICKKQFKVTSKTARPFKTFHGNRLAGKYKIQKIEILEESETVKIGNEKCQFLSNFLKFKLAEKNKIDKTLPNFHLLSSSTYPKLSRNKKVAKISQTCQPNFNSLPKLIGSDWQKKVAILPNLTCQFKVTNEQIGRNMNLAKIPKKLSFQATIWRNYGETAKNWQENEAANSSSTANF